MRLLEDKVIIIGGVGEGIGHSLAVRAAAQGAKVVMAARTASRLEAIEDEITKAGGTAISTPMDMSSSDDCRRVANSAIERFGRIDGLSIIACMEPDRKLFDEVDDDFEEWRRCMDFNVWGTMRLVKACLTGMDRGSSVAIVGSQVSHEAWPRVAAYAGAKAALGAMVRSISLEYGQKFVDKGVRFNMVSAGGIANAPYIKYVGELAEFNNRSFEEQRKLMTEAYPLGYVPPPEEYADMLIFMMSDMSKAVDGQDFHVNGGSYMKP